MVEERSFDYKDYIQKRLKEIDDLDERKYAKELLQESLGEVFTWAEEKYEALEKRVKDELDIPWRCFNIFTMVVAKENYDPINNFWHPVCEEDVNSLQNSEYTTIYLRADDKKRREFIEQGTIVGITAETGENIRFQIKKSSRYEKKIRKIYELFSNNHIPWQTVHMGHLERFFDLVPLEDVPEKEEVIIQWNEWQNYIIPGQIPLWNIQKIKVQSQEFRHPCLDEVIYEHIYYLGNEKTEEDGYLIETEENILSIRYEKNKVFLKTEKETLENVYVYQLHQGDKGNSYGYDRLPVLSNYKKDNLSVRYLQQTGNFIQTPMELCRKVEELSDSYIIQLTGYEIINHTEENVIEGDMNEFVTPQIFQQDKRNVLLFRFHREREDMDEYLYESHIRYILSQLQMEFLEYKCQGKLE